LQERSGALELAGTTRIGDKTGLPPRYVGSF
jgi:hypothetical protein